ncbi:hypothetical protein RHMOL_Rhmol07G0147900 [Rhododendron molle]|uniref:Uncharacterized protein n=2 Tax=Rhododendron molle TaxID=49168 RepID=A0ACC0N2Q3_RHOML|nr:hypothetical protein RHMOL_Rhmol07G0147900 [Rhododendron molle]KAI8546804.1 hypothetical protein RHMOL_Rhmol07G0147900 [Rhododendron molle]
MGKILYALLGRNPKAPKLKTLASLAIARIPILKNLHTVRCSHARSDVVQLLNLGYPDRALLRVELVIREQNMLDVLDIVENYCHRLIEGFLLVENNRECPEELNEAISSLIFAASRCRELPELQEIRMIFSSRYGNEFVDRAIELRNNCRVNLEMIQKLSKIQASLETRKKVLKQIAYNGINLLLDDNDYTTAVEKQDMNKNDEQLKPSEAAKLNNTEAGVYEKGGLERSFSSSSSNTDAEDRYDVTWTAYDLDQTASPSDEELDLDQSDEETGKNQNSMPWLDHPDPGSDTKSNLPIDIFQTTTRYNAVADESFSDTKGYKPHGDADLTTYSVEGRSGLGNMHYLKGEKRVYTRTTAFKRR